jgi:hypothetical protein
MCFSWTNSPATDFIDADADFNSFQLDPHPIERQADVIMAAIRIKLPILDFIMGSLFIGLETPHQVGIEGGIRSKAGSMFAGYAVMANYGISTCRRLR